MVAGDPASEGTSRGRRLLRMLALLLIGLVVLTGMVSYVRSRDWSAAEDRDNYLKLDIVGRALESWPKSAEDLARGNALVDRLEAPPAALSKNRDNWMATAELRLPSIGPAFLHYRVIRDVHPLTKLNDNDDWTTKAQQLVPPGGAPPPTSLITCPKLQSVSVTDAQLVMDGTLPLDELWQRDHEIIQDSRKVPEPGPREYAEFVKGLDPGTLFARFKKESAFFRRGCPALQYELAIPLKHVANLDNDPDNGNHRTFAEVLLIDPVGHVLAPLSDGRLPVENIRDIVPQAPEYRNMLTNSLAAVAKKPSDPKSSEDEARQAVAQAERASRPIDVVVAGEPYVAYFRPVDFDAPFALRECGQADSGETTRVKGLGLRAPGDSCMLIGLVPKRDLRARVISLSLDMLNLLVIVMMLAILLVPITKLYFLGPAGDMSTLQVGTVIVGLIGASALLTLTVLGMVEGLILHSKTSAMLDTLASAIAAQFKDELDGSLARPIALPGVRLTANQMARAGPSVEAGLDCRFADHSEVRPDYVQSPRHEEPLIRIREYPGQSAPLYWPQRELLLAFGEEGLAFPRYAGIAARCHSGGRTMVQERAYFIRALAGQYDGELAPRDARHPQGTCSRLPELAIDPRYAIDAVRSQTDGIPKVAVASRFIFRRDGTYPPEHLPNCDPPPTDDAHWQVTRTSIDYLNLTKGDQHQNIKDEVADLKKRFDHLPDKTVPADIDSEVATLQESLVPETGPRVGVMVQVLAMRSLLSPVLPAGYRFVVVDGIAPGLPYLFGSDADQIGAFRLADAIPAGPALDTINDELAKLPTDHAKHDAKADDPRNFRAEFEGVRQDFAAVRLPGTRWVLLVYREFDDIDKRMAKRIVWATGIWTAMALLLIIPALLLSAVKGARLWLWLWPRPRNGGAMKGVGLALVALALVGAIAVRVMQTPLVFAVVILMPLLAVSGAWAWLGRAGSDEPDPADLETAELKALRPSDERGFQWLWTGLVLVIGVVPMFAAYLDARNAENELSLAREIAHLDDAIQQNREALRAIITAYGLDHPAPEMARSADGGEWYGWPGFDPNGTTSDRRAKGLEWITFRLRSYLGLQSSLALRDCRPSGTDPAEGDFFCMDSMKNIGVIEQPRLKGGLLLVANAVACFLGALASIVLLVKASRAMMVALFGFGVPLEAVESPKIARNGGKLDLARRAIVLNGPLALLDELECGGERFDIAQADDGLTTFRMDLSRHRRRLVAGEPIEKATVVVIGLDVALKDPAHRASALAALESLHETGSGRLIIMTDLSPLDRILQAYEREVGEIMRPGEAGTAAISRTEQLRWSRLFEDFTTYPLAVHAKFLWSDHEQKEAERSPMVAKLDPDRQAGVFELMRETQYLPEKVIQSLIGGKWKSAGWNNLRPHGYPISPSDYDDLYGDHMLEWACTVRPATKEAAIDYLRGLLIEHYQHVWAASSRAERVILDSLARGRVINIKAALAIRSLIRRGLVMLNPNPRLVNKSFAAFVRQAEKPEALVAWRDEQPKGAWDRIARPLAYVVPAAIIALAALAVLAGESFATVLPIVLGAVPALLSTLTPGRKGG
jgi:hypothetical protein